MLDIGDSTACKNIIKKINNGDKLKLEIQVSLLEELAFCITDEDLVEGSFSIDRYVQTGDKLEIGTCAASELNMTLFNDDGRFDDKRFEGAELLVRVYFESAPTTWYTLGTFTVDEKPRTLDTITISALDDMVKFDALVADDVSFDNISFGALLTTCCTKCNVTLDTVFCLEKYPLWYKTVPCKPDDEQLTYRDVIKYIAEVGFCCAYITAENTLRLGWYGDTNSFVHILDADNIFDRTMDDERKGISTVTVKNGDEQKEVEMYFANSTSYPAYYFVRMEYDKLGFDYGRVLKEDYSDIKMSLSFELTDVPFGAVLLQSENLKDVCLKKILRGSEVSSEVGASTPFEYIPFSAKTFSYFFIEPLDIITIEDLKTGKQLDTVVTHTTFTLNGQMLIEAKGESETKSGYATINPLTAQERNILNEIRQSTQNRLDGVLNDVTSREHKLIEFNKALNNGSALYKHSFTNYTLYTDKEDINASRKFMAVSSAGVGWGTGAWNESTYVDSNGNLKGHVFDYFIDFNGNAVLGDLDTYRINSELITCDNITSITANLGGWQVNSEAIYKDLDLGNNKMWRVYYQAPFNDANANVEERWVLSSQYWENDVYDPNKGFKILMNGWAYFPDLNSNVLKTNEAKFTKHIETNINSSNIFDAVRHKRTNSITENGVTTEYSYVGKLGIGFVGKSGTVAIEISPQGSKPVARLDVFQEFQNSATLRVGGGKYTNGVLQESLQTHYLCFQDGTDLYLGKSATSTLLNLYGNKIEGTEVRGTEVIGRKVWAWVSDNSYYDVAGSITDIYDSINTNSNRITTAVSNINTNSNRITTAVSNINTLTSNLSKLSQRVAALEAKQ